MEKMEATKGGKWNLLEGGKRSTRGGNGIPGEALRTYAYGGGQSKKFSCNPRMSLRLHCNPKISAHFIHINLFMNMEYPETMQIEVRIASSEPRNIS